jgi:GAF domain-containing protein
VELIPESLEALARLSVLSEHDLLSQLGQTAALVVALVPECVGMSVAYFDDDVTFTLLATSERLRVLDAAQYLDGGPCQVAALTGDELEVDDLLDENTWQLFAMASAAQGVRSSLSLPLRSNHRIDGSINFYGHTTHAFTGRERALAVMFGAAVEEAMTNADLTMASVDRARDSVTRLHDHDKINQAIGIMASREYVPLDVAEDRLYDAANRAGITPLALAELIIRTKKRTE